MFRNNKHRNKQQRLRLLVREESDALGQVQDPEELLNVAEEM